MTFFNKKAEVMQIEMTPYGRYLYSVGKFKPHSYEFVDDDILYKSSGSFENQEDIHSRITEQTPKIKIFRSYVVEEPLETGQIRLDQKINNKKMMNKEKSNPIALGKSSYSSDNAPELQVTMVQGEISSSNSVFDKSNSSEHGLVNIPQVNIDFNIFVTIKNVLDESRGSKILVSPVDDGGNYVELSYESKIMHFKEFNSFYEKENFDVEVFVSGSNHELIPLNFDFFRPIVVNDVLQDNSSIGPSEETSFEEGRQNKSLVGYYFDVNIDDFVADEDICSSGYKLEITNNMLDRKIECPDQRIEQFDIYSTRVTPDDLENCD